MQQNFISNYSLLQTTYPLLIDRLLYLLLARTISRDRANYNNSVASFEVDPVYGQDIDLLYYQLSLQTENQIVALKNTYQPVVKPFVDILNILDSSQFCPQIVGMPINDTISSVGSGNIANLNLAGFQSYQVQIEGIVAACKAAYNGDTTTIQNIYNQGIDLDQVDYDKRTPLYFAVRGAQVVSVNLLLKLGVNVNPIDRWGGTPLNYASGTILQILSGMGAKLGKNQTFIANSMQTWTMSSNDERLMYSSQQDDLVTANILYQFGWNLNQRDIDGRTALHVAAANGFLDMVQFLVSKGFDMTILDSRGNDPMTDANNAQHSQVGHYLGSVIGNTLIQQYCPVFYGGVLSHGIATAISYFQKAFLEQYITIQNTHNYTQLLILLKGYYINNGIVYTDPIAKLVTYQFTDMQILAQIQDLYTSQQITASQDVIVSTLSSFFSQYLEYSQVIFALFIVFEVIALFFLRRLLMNRLRVDILQSRGILNLIPNHIIFQNKQAMEAIIKKLQN